jgi:hypothetical protein
MRRTAYSTFMLPGLPGKRPHASRWKMTNEDAAKLGAVSIVPGTTEWREEPETDAERLAFYTAHPSAGHDAVAHAQPRAAPYPAPKA